MKTQNILIGVTIFGLVGLSIYSIVQIKNLKATIKSQGEKHEDILDKATNTVNKLKNVVKQNTDDLSSLSIKK